MNFEDLQKVWQCQHDSAKLTINANPDGRRLRADRGQPAAVPRDHILARCEGSGRVCRVGGGFPGLRHPLALVVFVFLSVLLLFCGRLFSGGSLHSTPEATGHQ